MQNVLKRFGAKATDLSNKNIGSFEARYSQSLTKLTLLYTLILAAILLISSAVSYSAFSSRVQRRFDHMPPPGTIIIHTLPVVETNFHTPTADEVRDDFIRALIIVNTSLLALAGILSYFLAKQTLQPIKDAYDAQREFLADASHELRTPLSILQLDIENTLANPKLGKNIAAQTRSNLEEVERMTRIVNDLLFLSRHDESVSSSLTLVDVSLDELLKNTIEHIRPLAQKEGVTLERAPHTDVHLKTNADLLDKAISNILKNAIIYNKEGGSVSVRVNATQKEISIAITDTGIGMKKEDLAKIFDRFYRADESRSRASGGSGLGLSIVRSSIESLGGSVRAESQLDKGTTITISLPLK